jgi:hypothetical protein
MLQKYLRYIVAFILAFVFPATAFATPPIEADGVVNIAAGAQRINLGGSFSHVIVALSSGSSTVNITFNSGVNASATNGLLASGSGFAYGLVQGSRATDQINYFGGGAVGTLSYWAW